MATAQHTKAGLRIHGYADDLVMVVVGKFVDTLCGKMQHGLHLVEKWCRRNGLTINAAKTQMVLFTRKRRIVGFYEPKLFGLPLHRVSKAKHLGIILDEKLLWKEHLDDRVKKATRVFWPLRKSLGKR